MPAVLGRLLQKRKGENRIVLIFRQKRQEWQQRLQQNLAQVWTAQIQSQEPAEGKWIHPLSITTDRKRTLLFRLDEQT